MRQESSGPADDGLARLTGGELRQLLRLLDGTDVEELELELGDTRLFCRRVLRDKPAASAAERASAAPEEADRTVIAADRVGFYHLPKGMEGGFKVGDRVGLNETLGVVDALNVTNPVVATRAGRLDEVLVEDGQPVQYGQPLFVVRAGE